jgi:hypothetical protein
MLVNFTWKAAAGATSFTSDTGMQYRYPPRIMGLSIHYKGSICNTDSIPMLVSELQDICESLQWDYHPIDDENFQGIVFFPPDCEALFFTFHNGVQLASPVLWDSYREALETISVKTQYAGVDVHIAVIRLLRYLSEKYFDSFECHDEGQYWETNDEAVLRTQFGRYEAALNMLAGAFENMEVLPGEDADALANRLKEALGDQIEIVKITCDDPDGPAQMNMTSGIIPMLRQIGIDDSKELQLEFFFYTDREEKAAALATELRSMGYLPEFRHPAPGSSMYLITGWTGKIQMHEERILKWAREMCDIGSKYDCDFDGWGTSPCQ